MVKVFQRLLAGVLVMGIVAVLPAAPSDTLTLSLRQALSLAVGHNPVIRIDRLDVDIARTYVKENLYHYEPVVGASVSRSRGLGDSADSDPAQSASVQLTQSLPTGGSIQASGAIGPSSARSAAALAGGDHARTASVSFTQALLQGAGLGVNLAPLRRASADVELRHEELAGYAQRLLAETERAYWDLYLADREAGIRGRALELAKRLLYESEERLRVGQLAALDLAVVRAEVASRDKALIDAQTAREQKRYRLLYLIGDSPRGGWETTVVIGDSLPEPVVTDLVDSHAALALKQRPDLRQARSQAAKGELDVVASRNGLLPRLDFFITLQGTVYAESFAGEALARIPRDGSLSGGLSLSLPASNGAARQRHVRSLLARRQAHLAIKNLERLTHMEVRSAYVEVSRAQRQIAAARSASLLQEEKLAAEQERMAAGKSTNYFVTLAQRDLTAAQLDEARARVAYVTALTDLFLKDGSLLERRGVVGVARE